VSDSDANMTFWEHLEALRHVIFRILAVVMIAAIAAFVFNDTLFGVLLAPSRSDFVFYRMLARLGAVTGMSSLVPASFNIHIISVELTSQFMISMSTSIYAGLLIVAPYVLYELFGFIKPALYAEERKYSGRLIFCSYFLFMIGVLINYFLVFPLTFRFLSTYQVDKSIENMITLSSYVDTFMMLTIAMGIIFEIPILSWVLAKLHILNSVFMRQYRRYAVVIVLIAGAIITPTSDVFTLLIVSIPIYALYELSILIVSRVENQRTGD
jgi:sec-independent protein translocase protein TatC